MKIGLFITLFALGISSLSCKHTQKLKSSDSLSTSPKNTSKSVDSLEKSKNLYIKNDSLCIIIDKMTYCIPRNTSINYKNSFAGIYQIGKDSIKKSYAVVLNRLIYFTIYEDLGMGYRGHLYVFDTNKRTLINDPYFKRNFLYSSAGIFIIDKGENKIFSISKPEWYERKQTTIIAASMYSVKEDAFQFLKTVYEKGDNIENDTTIVNFYHKSLAKGSHGLLLPQDWLK